MAPHQHLLQPVAAPQQRPGGALHRLGAHGLDARRAAGTQPPVIWNKNHGKIMEKHGKTRGFSRCFRPETMGKSWKIMENLELIPLISGGKVDFCSAEVDDLWCIQLVDGD